MERLERLVVGCVGRVGAYWAVGLLEAGGTTGRGGGEEEQTSACFYRRGICEKEKKRNELAGYWLI